jgi:uncharacterized protein YqgV (UPF0045/DUF77 family)
MGAVSAPERAVTVEFTVEPFVEGKPGPHVIAAVAAVEAAGFQADMGPFGTSFAGSEATTVETVASLLRAALEQGATRVSVQVTVTP